MLRISASNIVRAAPEVSPQFRECAAAYVLRVSSVERDLRGACKEGETEPVIVVDNWSDLKFALALGAVPEHLPGSVHSSVGHVARKYMDELTTCSDKKIINTLSGILVLAEQAPYAAFRAVQQADVYFSDSESLKNKVWQQLFKVSSLVKLSRNYTLVVHLADTGTQRIIRERLGLENDIQFPFGTKPQNIKSYGVRAALADYERLRPNFESNWKLKSQRASSQRAVPA